MKRTLAGLGLGAAALFAASNAVFTVDRSEQALVLRFGQPVRVANADGRSQGLYLKWPFLEQVARLDRRSLVVQAAPQDVATSDQETLNVSASMRYRITDPLRFYAARREGLQLQSALASGVRAAFSGASAQDLLDAGEGPRPQVARVQAQRAAAQAHLGVAVEAVDLVNVAPPDAEADALGRRMQASELAEAAQVRTDGEAHKRELIAQADHEAADIRGEGERQALEIRGDGDAQRAAILGAAYSQDPAFARFFRRLDAYDQALNPDNTTLVLSPDTAFLDLFARGPQGGGKPR